VAAAQHQVVAGSSRRGWLLAQVLAMLRLHLLTVLLRVTAGVLLWQPMGFISRAWPAVAQCSSSSR
jgi:hypothetical protein